MMKVGSSTFQALGFDKMPKSAATKALLDARQVRAIVVRNPIDRFMSWHNDKIVHGSTAGVLAYNTLLLHQRSSMRHPPLVYAEAIGRRPQGAWDLEYHLSPMSRMCHLGILQYDVVGDLLDLPSFWQALDELNVSLPRQTSGNTVSGRVTRAHEREIGCSLHNAIMKIYRQDFCWLRKLTRGSSRHLLKHIQLRLNSPPANCTQIPLCMK